MAEKRVSKKTATNQNTGRLKKGFKAKGGGVYVQVTAAPKKPTKRKAKSKTTKKITGNKLTKKIRKLFK